MLTKRMIEDVVEWQLEERSFEEMLSDFDLSPTEVFWELFKLGLIDPELMERLYG